jgi:hypothetical protein
MIIVGTIRQLDLDNRTGRLEGSDGSKKVAVPFNYNHLADKVKRYFIENTRVVVTLGNGSWVNSIEPVGIPNNPNYDRLYDACCVLVREPVRGPDDIHNRMGVIADIIKGIELERT